MLYRSYFPRDLFADFDRLQREMQGMFDAAPAIRGLGRGGYPAINVGSTPQAVEVYVFAPGLKPEQIEVHLERGVLTVSGEREDLATGNGANAANGGNAAEGAPAGNGTRITVHSHERFSGRFRRVLSLPDDIDPDQVSAEYRDGVLCVHIARRQASQPRRITIQ